MNPIVYWNLIYVIFRYNIRSVISIFYQVFQGTLKVAKDNGMLCDIDESLLFPNVNKLYKVS